MHQHPRTTDQRGGKRRTVEKRKLPDQGRNEQQHQPQQQRKISDLLSSSPPHHRDHQFPSSPKRFRTSSPSANKNTDEPISPTKMYSFSNSESKAGSGLARNVPSPATAQRPTNFTPHTGAKRLVVKNLRSKPRLNQDTYFNKIWDQLSVALDAVFEGGKPAASLEELYKGAENVCRQGRAEMLAKKLQERCKTYVYNELRQSLVAKAQSSSEINTLRAVVNAWGTWNSKLVSEKISFG
jgi:hypothetical protein